MALLEHILTSCTPVAEAHALLSILQQAGTVPWRTMEPYLKVLRDWHVECGRGPVGRVKLISRLSNNTAPTLFGDRSAPAVFLEAFCWFYHSGGSLVSLMTLFFLPSFTENMCFPLCQIANFGSKSHVCVFLGQQYSVDISNFQIFFFA